jgi:hypothetical protein
MSTLNAVLTLLVVIVVVAGIVTFGFILPAWGVWRERPAAHARDASYGPLGSTYAGKRALNSLSQSSAWSLTR